MFGSLYNLIPLHSELEVIRYLSGIHFCGLILASISVSRFVNFVCSVFKLEAACVKNFLLAFIFLAASFSIVLHMRHFKEHVHMSEVSVTQQQVLMKLRDHPSPGRIYGNAELGKKL